ncbi:hypothetical protein R533_20700 [Salmonella enterica subsp. houtenae serovar 40:z4,z32:-]|nr:hypothetical protein R533_20700 [Salmonella enterica subsp. houtenae serovar 40:z4,z32:-]OSD75115.1 hypothetical protein R529_19795 [Salmonella enterica subsp. houtenae serovar 40:z4,z32:-]OSD88346.1 hypothetical protein R526_21115 [Salmonella enterica subsp. houtenae serovar 40:z4,z32:-]OSE26975.1 hypothetical protein R517_19785 [Salmonella enterica subsp. houtenae serovar 40:z4,z32:-]OSE72087.1 hypothetical protein R591_19525 [Salmonella enterica subsp. houtenae serovar 40:z4,z32:-]
MAEYFSRPSQFMTGAFFIGRKKEKSMNRIRRARSPSGIYCRMALIRPTHLFGVLCLFYWR